MSSVLWKASVSSACQEDPVAPLITLVYENGDSEPEAILEVDILREDVIHLQSKP